MLDKEKIQQLERYLKQSKNIQFILEKAPILKMPNWYLAAGCIAQTVWNVNHDYNLCCGIKDYDIVYYDVSDIFYESEDYYIKKAKSYLRKFQLKLEIRREFIYGMKNILAILFANINQLKTQ